MDRGHIKRRNQDESRGLDKVIAKIVAMLQRCMIQPGKREALLQIADRLIPGIRNHRKQVPLAPYHRGRGTVVGTPSGNPYPQPQDLPWITAPQMTPALGGGIEHALRVRADLNCKAQWIKDRTERKRDLAQKRVLFAGLSRGWSARLGPSTCTGIALLRSFDHLELLQMVPSVAAINSCTSVQTG